jgi:hypothetical protein
MRKIPTLFLRNDPDDPHHVTADVNPAAAWVLTSSFDDIVATRKYDGTCVMLDDDGQWWARREVKPGKAEPAGWVLADVDEVTGKRMGWVPIEPGWNFYAMFREAMEWATVRPGCAGTYELCGPKIQGNPEGYSRHTLIAHSMADGIQHGGRRLMVDCIAPYRQLHGILTDPGFTFEGIVWHHIDGRMAKLKRKDFRRP